MNAAGVRPRIGNLQEIIVSLFGNPQHLLDLGFGLEQEVLRAAAPQNEDRRLASAALRRENDGGGFVHVGGDVQLELIPGQRLGGDVHPDRAVARRRGINGQA